MSESAEETTDRFADLENGMRICFRDTGDESKPALLLIGGLGEDLTFWTDEVVESLVAAGLRVIALDNRDVGRSTFVHAPPPPFWRQMVGLPRSDSYTLPDMAEDAIGVLDHLGVDRVHLVGRSMGGMIAQTIASTLPSRVRTLTSLYSTTGARGVGGQAWSTIRILAVQAATNRTAAVREHLQITRHIAGTAHPIDEVTEARIAVTGWNRCAGDQAAGVARQIQAIKVSGSRTEQLRDITAPTLVINGDRDLMIDPSGGRTTAEAIPGAEHVIIPGMGHHMPASLVETIIRHIARHIGRG